MNKKEFDQLADQFMSTVEAAEKWGMDIRYVNYHCAKGNVLARKIGKCYVLLRNQPSPQAEKKARTPS